MFKLKLKNYRGFVDEEFDFSRVNILIGENSSGKSSIFKFLLALKQSLESSENRDYNLILSGKEVDLGNYKEMIYQQKVDLNLEFAFCFAEKYIEYYNDKASTLHSSSIALPNFSPEGETTISFEFTNELGNHESLHTCISNDSIGSLNIKSEKSNKNNRICDLFFKDASNNTYILKQVTFEKKAFLTRVYTDNLRKKIEQTYGTEKLEQLFYKLTFLLLVNDYIEHTLTDIYYSNPLISEPAQRTYLKRDEKTTLNIKDIQEVVYLLGAENFVKGDELNDFIQKYKDLLIGFGIVENFELKESFSTIELRVNVGGITNNIKDVGYGVSIQMPILAQALLLDWMKIRSAPDYTIMLIEQPEAHLHPSLQAKFIRSLLSIGKNNIYFIETHSEHIIRMLQLMVKNHEYDLKAEDISISYLRKENGNVIKTTHNINPETGKLKPAFPKGFYDVSYDLAFQLMD